MKTITQQTAFQLPQPDEKETYVQQLFSKVSRYYDLMNDIMSAGLHRLWKKQAIELLQLRPGGTVLDVCCGTGDVSFYLTRMVPRCIVTGMDFCNDMLAIARKRAEEKGLTVQFVQGDAMDIPFGTASFQGAIISYGLRNVVDYEGCLREIYRILKPGARLVILDMSHPQGLAEKLSHTYRYRIMPLMGKLVANDANSYHYLSNSIHFYPTQEELVALMQKVGFKQAGYHNILGGISAMHCGIKP